MKTPFDVLGVGEKADDDQIKQAYLAAAKLHPPDRDPLKFQEIRAAFDKISNRKNRLCYLLFDVSIPEPEEIADLVLTEAKMPRLTLEDFRARLRRGIEKSGRQDTAKTTVK